MKKIYIQPALTSVIVNSERPLAGSNEVFGQGIDFNKSTMESDSGDDAAVKGANDSFWDYDWNE
jgi:hypothetical protein